MATIETIKGDALSGWLIKIPDHKYNNLSRTEKYSSTKIAVKSSNKIRSVFVYHIKEDYLIILYMYTLYQYRRKNYCTDLLNWALNNETKFIARIFARVYNPLSVSFLLGNGFEYLGQDKKYNLLFERDMYGNTIMERLSEKQIIKNNKSTTWKQALYAEPHKFNHTDLLKARLVK